MRSAPVWRTDRDDTPEPMADCSANFHRLNCALRLSADLMANFSPRVDQLIQNDNFVK